MTTRILRLLLLAALAWPTWLSSAAQEMVRVEKKQLKHELIDSRHAKPSLTNETRNENEVIPPSGGPQKAPARTLTEVTVANGTATSTNVPVRGNYYSVTGYKAQMIYPSSMLTELKGKRIRSITFHAPNGIKFGNPDGNYNTGRLKVSMVNTTTTSFSNQQRPITLPEAGVVTALVIPEYNSTILKVNFNSTLKYTGGNILVDVLVETRGTGGNTTFYGQSNNNTYRSLYSSSSTSYGTSERFLPKATFEIEDDISIDTENLDFGIVATGDSKNLSFTLTNNNPTAAAISWEFTGINKDKFSTTSQATTIAANGTLTVPVTFAPGNALGAMNSILKVTVGNTKYRIILRGKGKEDLAFSASQSMVDVGEVLVNGSGTKTVTITNSGIETITPSIVQPDDNAFSVTGQSGDLASGASREYTVTFAPTEVKEYSSSFCVVDDGRNVSINVDVKGEGVNTASLTQVVAALKTNAPFSVANSSVTIDANGTATVAVTFKPTAATSYGDYLTVTVDGHENQISLKGIGNDASTIATRDESFFDGITYTWKEGGPDATGVEHTSKLTDIATDPDQMIAMIKKIYTDKTIPGNYKRGFDANGNDEVNNDVFYTGVGTISYNYDDVSKISDLDGYSYVDRYGWNIEGEIETPTYYDLSSTYREYYTHMNTTQYKPNQEGLTLLLVELNDDYDYNDIIEEIDGSLYYKGFGDTNYDRLRGQFENTIKSIRVIAQSKRTGEGLEAGTLFKLDCDKMNKFYLLAKGQVRLLHNSYIHFNNDFSIPPSFFIERTREYYLFDYSDSYASYGFVDENVGGLFYHMFEQFSPVDPDATSGKADIYQDLVNMQTFGVEHDCLSIPNLGHQFMMYGDDSEAKDCQDVRDMMFFVPDYRMMKDNDRDYAVYQQYLNYNKAHQPQMGLYVIRQDPVTETTEFQENDEYYHLTLTWDSNLDEFLPSDQQEYQLYEVVVDEATGAQRYEPVYYTTVVNNEVVYADANGNPLAEGAEPVAVTLTVDPSNNKKTYADVYVQREESGKVVTYAVRGQDKDHFLSLQMSNQQSYLIRGKNPAEMAMLMDKTHYSRFNPITMENAYSNAMMVSPQSGGVRKEYIEQGTEFNFYRTTGTIGEEPVKIATATVLSKVETEDRKGGDIKIQMIESTQASESQFPYGQTSGMGEGKHAGYHDNANIANPTYSYIKVGNVDYVTFNNFMLYDNFVEKVKDDNSHPSQYFYYMTFNTEQPFTGSDGNPTTEATSNRFRVPVYKTESKINNVFTQNQVDEDTEGTLSLEDLAFSTKLQYSSKSEIYRYDAYRWLANENRFIINEVYGNDDEQDLPPTGIAGNQSSTYSISMNDIGTEDYYVGAQVTVPENDYNKWADFVDYIPNKESSPVAAYTYAPVVETFSGSLTRDDYNTYGGALRTTAAGKLKVSVVEPDVENPLMSTWNWEDNEGNKYAYYNLNLNIDQKDFPDDYDIYKIRAWRMVNENQLGEEYSEMNYRKAAKVKFEEITYPECDKSDSYKYQLGSGNDSKEVEHSNGTKTTISFKTGTFGARKLREKENETGVIEDLEINYLVRVYFTKNTNLQQTQQGAPRVRVLPEQVPVADNGYYFVDAKVQYTAKAGNVITGIESVQARQVAGVKYYNVAGVESDRPFKGVNIVVTRYSDGSMSTTKIVK